MMRFIQLLYRKVPIYSDKTKEELQHILTANYEEYIAFYSSNTISVESNLKIGKEEAIQLKEEIRENEYSYQVQMYKGDNLNIPEIFFSDNINKWILKDAYLLPISFKTVNKNLSTEEAFIIKSEYNLDNKEKYPLLSELQFSTSALGLSEYFPEEYTFTLDSGKIKESLSLRKKYY